MPKPIAKVDDLYVDGIPIRIDWGAWDVGMSVFVPCTKPIKAGKQAREIARRKGYTVDLRTRVEGGHLGVRIWRTA